MLLEREQEIYTVCPVCGGDGVITRSARTPPYSPEDTPCHQCLGAGGILWGFTVNLGGGPPE